MATAIHNAQNKPIIHKYPIIHVWVVFLHARSAYPKLNAYHAQQAISICIYTNAPCNAIRHHTQTKTSHASPATIPAYDVTQQPHVQCVHFLPYSTTNHA